MVEDKGSGLIIPEHVAEEKREEEQVRAVWTDDDVRFLRRVQRWAQGQELDIVFHCQKCDEYLEWGNGDSGVEVTCACKRRVTI